MPSLQTATSTSVDGHQSVGAQTFGDVVLGGSGGVTQGVPGWALALGAVAVAYLLYHHGH